MCGQIFLKCLCHPARPAMCVRGACWNKSPPSCPWGAPLQLRTYLPRPWAAHQDRPAPLQLPAAMADPAQTRVSALPQQARMHAPAHAGLARGRPAGCGKPACRGACAGRAPSSSECSSCSRAGTPPRDTPACRREPPIWSATHSAAPQRAPGCHLQQQQPSGLGPPLTQTLSGLAPSAGQAQGPCETEEACPCAELVRVPWLILPWGATSNASWN